MAIIKPNNNTISAITALPAGISTGKVLQVVNSDNNYSTTTTSTSATDVLSASGVTWEPTITPSSTSSKIIVSVNLMAKSSAGVADTRSRIDIYYKIGSGSYTSLSNNQMYSLYDYGGSGVSFSYRQPFQYLITPSSTSAITIKFTCSSINASCTTEVNPSGVSANSSCILYEVA